MQIQFFCSLARSIGRMAGGSAAVQPPARLL